MLSKIIILTVGSISLTGWAQVLEDPTRPSQFQMQHSGAAKKTTRAALTLQAIMQQGNNRLAVINGQPVKVGETILDAVIQEISARSVVVSRETDGELKTITLQLAHSGTIKTNAAENY